MQPVCLSASLPDAVMRTHHFRSEVIYLARNFKVRSCSLFLSTYRCGLLLMKSHSKLFILHERHNVLFHFLGCFFFHIKCEFFICVTLTGQLIYVISQQSVTSRKAVLAVRARPPSVQLATQSPVIDRTVNTCRAGRLCDRRASPRLLCLQPSPAPCPLSGKLPAWLRCCRGRSQKNPDLQPAWQAPHFMTLYS